MLSRALPGDTDKIQSTCAPSSRSSLHHFHEHITDKAKVNRTVRRRRLPVFSPTAHSRMHVLRLPAKHDVLPLVAVNRRQQQRQRRRHYLSQSIIASQFTHDGGESKYEIILENVIALRNPSQAVPIFSLSLLAPPCSNAANVCRSPVKGNSIWWWCCCRC